MKRMRRAAVSTVAVSASALALLLTPSASQANSKAQRHWPIEAANPGISKNLVDALPEVVKKSRVKVSPDFRVGTTIVYPDGSLVEGQPTTSRTAAALAYCSSWRQVTGLAGGAWGPISHSDCSVFGAPGRTVTYNYVVSNDVNSTGCFKWRGYDFNAKEIWQQLGCGSSGQTGYAMVPWGNVLSTPASRARSLGVVAGFTAQWRH